MISKGFKDRIKDLLYLYYKIQCNKFITSSDTFYFINAKDQLGQILYLTLDIYGNEFGNSNPSHFNVYINGEDVINKKLFMIDKVQNAISKSSDFLKDLKVKSITSLDLEIQNENYILLSGGCSMGRSYLNIDYTIPYSEDNGFILFGNKQLYKIADITVKAFDCTFKISDEAKSFVSTNYLTDFIFNLKDDSQTALDDYILKTIVSYDLSLYSYKFTDLEIINFLKSFKYDLVTYDNIKYVKDFYTVINMVEI